MDELRDLRGPYWPWARRAGLRSMAKVLLFPKSALTRVRRPVLRRWEKTRVKLRSGVRSAICMPLRRASEPLASFQLFNCRLDTLTDYTISFLHVLCDYAAIAIDNARAVERIQELTITDDCTGLYNVRHLYSVLESRAEGSRPAAPILQSHLYRP